MTVCTAGGSFCAVHADSKHVVLPLSHQLPIFFTVSSRPAPTSQFWLCIFPQSIQGRIISLLCFFFTSFSPYHFYFQPLTPLPPSRGQNPYLLSFPFHLAILHLHPRPNPPRGAAAAMLSVTTPPADASPLLVMHCAPCVCFRPIAWHDTLLTSQSPGTNRITLPESLPTSPVSLEMGCVFRDLLVLVQFGFVLWFCRPLFEIRCAQRH